MLTEKENARQVTQQKIRWLFAQGHTEAEIIEKLSASIWVALYGRDLVMNALDDVKKETVAQ